MRIHKDTLDQMLSHQGVDERPMAVLVKDSVNELVVNIDSRNLVIAAAEARAAFQEVFGSVQGGLHTHTMEVSV